MPGRENKKEGRINPLVLLLLCSKKKREGRGKSLFPVFAGGGIVKEETLSRLPPLCDKRALRTGLLGV